MPDESFWSQSTPAIRCVSEDVSGKNFNSIFKEFFKQKKIQVMWNMDFETIPVSTLDDAML